MEQSERILVKARELFMRLGIRSVSMDDIASHLGMSKKTIYQFFADKDELVDRMMDNELELMQQDCRHCFLNARDAVDEIFLTMDMIIEQFRHLNPVVLSDLAKFHYRTWRRVEQHKEEFVGKIIADNLQRGIAEGLYRPDINVEVMTRYRLGSMMMPFNTDVFPLRKFDLADVSRMLIEHYVYGLATAKGHKLIEKYKSDAQRKLTINGHAK